MSGNAWHLRQYLACQASPDISGLAPNIRPCPQYQALPQMSGLAIIIGPCPSYSALPQLLGLAPIIRPCHYYWALPLLLGLLSGLYNTYSAGPVQEHSQRGPSILLYLIYSVGVCTCCCSLTRYGFRTYKKYDGTQGRRTHMGVALQRNSRPRRE